MALLHIHVQTLHLGRVAYEGALHALMLRSFVQVLTHSGTKPCLYSLQHCFVGLRDQEIGPSYALAVLLRYNLRWVSSTHVIRLVQVCVKSFYLSHSSHSLALRLETSLLRSNHTCRSRRGFEAVLSGELLCSTLSKGCTAYAFKLMCKTLIGVPSMSNLCLTLRAS